MAEVPGFMLTGVPFSCWIFLFSHRSSKACDANIAIIANFGCFVKKLYCLLNFIKVNLISLCERITMFKVNSIQNAYVSKPFMHPVFTVVI